MYQGIMPIHENEDMEALKDTIIKLEDARWTRLFAIYAEARAALAEEGERDDRERRNNSTFKK